ncbi:hypothetical protein Pmani_026692 [Petrolisthes manimaculis]|uniref:Uncharacterized protein n=1 Tax=Petrolisthes manimaculis TaxID=1843537 RepID=A0AAE1TXK8_9EUCA|nr:hypothetical protein Pmani_026692 [Petrolisthes manimaculis]
MTEELIASWIEEGKMRGKSHEKQTPEDEADNNNNNKQEDKVREQRAGIKGRKGQGSRGKWPRSPQDASARVGLLSRVTGDVLGPGESRGGGVGRAGKEGMGIAGMETAGKGWGEQGKKGWG